jgi:putative tricarboxylic transport membrane protein
VELLDHLALGFSVAFSLENLLICTLGVFVGTAVGVLPGLGPTATISLLLPVTFGLEPTSAIILLAGIYYGSMYGGSITSILLHIPGEASSVITCIDGYRMARQGRGGAALGMAAFGSFIGGTVGIIGLSLVGPALARLALRFGPVELAALLVLGMVMVCFVGTGAMWRSLLMVGAGLLLSTVGLDPVLATERFTFGVPVLTDGFNIAVLAMGLFGIAEVLLLAMAPDEKRGIAASDTRLRALLPGREEWRRSAGPIARGSVLGFLLGLLPGGGGVIASFASYIVEKRLAARPERFGKGAIEGVAGPETANNAAAQSTFAPLLSLGIPSNVVLAIMLGALMIHGVTPGPKLIAEHPDLFWGVVASMYVGNALLIVLNVPLIRIFVAMLRVPQGLLSPAIIVFCVVGAYSLNNSLADVVAMLAFGVVGLGLRLAGYDPAPLLLSFTLGGFLETSLRQALLIGGGRADVFLDSPIAASLLGLAALMLLWPLLRRAVRGAA